MPSLSEKASDPAQTAGQSLQSGKSASSSIFRKLEADCYDVSETADRNCCIMSVRDVTDPGSRSARHRYRPGQVWPGWAHRIGHSGRSVALGCKTAQLAPFSLTEKFSKAFLPTEKKA